MALLISPHDIHYMKWYYVDIPRSVWFIMYVFPAAKSKVIHSVPVYGTLRYIFNFSPTWSCVSIATAIHNRKWVKITHICST